MKTQKGFTLHELFLAIFIMSILTMMAVPSFNSLFINIRMNTLTNKIITALNLARARAITEIKVFYVVPKNNDWSNGYYVVRENGIGKEDNIIWEGEGIPSGYHLDVGASRDGEKTVLNYVTYDIDGSTKMTARFILCEKEHGDTPVSRRIKIIEMSPTGKVSMAKDRDGNGIPEQFNSISGNFEDVKSCSR